MSGTLKDRARQMAGRDEPAGEQPTLPAAGDDQAAEQLPEADIDEPGADGPEQVPVHVAWSRVMGLVRKVSKADRVDAGNAGRYNYRGVDRALNAFGPACRLHGVLVLPVKVEPTYRDTLTSQKKPAHECTVLVTYRIIGPKGDHLDVQAAGEALDSSDKATAKAQSVALRTLLYHAGLVPSGDPDPELSSVERGEAPIRTAADYRDEVLNPAISRGRLAQIRYEVRQNGRAGELVVNDTGDEEQLLALIDRFGRERFGKGGGQ